MEGCSPICIHFWVVISKLITLVALLKFAVILSLFWKQWCLSKGSAWHFIPHFSEVMMRSAVYIDQCWPTFYPDEPISYSGVKRKLGALASPLPHDCTLCGATAVLSFPEPIKVNRYLVSVGCVCPSGGSYLSSGCRMCSWPCFAGGLYVGLCHSPAKEWGLAACLLCVVTTSDVKLLRLPEVQELL